ncbi:alpha-L-arabinofuranosidase [Curtobacterium sp. MCPF17_047]|uniref:arabinosylfuranosidase ArfA n=1 Tax=unclassified Curtobacterium TaxID=257496 RepID=UPI000DAA789A|nr:MULTISPECIES: alpha-L-arabinofuranosidase C-terminal domain-containing protein [unclassified Curtobacterium]PZE56660.1 alpha-L-arabinofuranosidase [Curtobacterium sp. MCPF17_001]PZF64852.1 alpha-L-arabinofuranosidase [Curtobacterium sp. MCPF17_047]
MPRTHLVLDSAFTVGPVRRRLFGGFVEHLGRHVYDGIHEPAHESADEHGFRKDVIELVKELGVTTIRYPGGNFVSGYKWEDGVGPVEQRPRRLDLAWHSTETNEVGLHEFQQWLDSVGSELMLAVNLGTRGAAEAIELLEYANIPGGTARSEERKANGREEPFGITMWCLGNEMDGPWQLGHKNAEDYGKLAAMTAKAMRQIQPDLELVACGSSGASMPTFGEWERTVLEHAYEDVDYISAHAYYEEDQDLTSFLASGANMDHFIKTVTTAADHVQAHKGSDKRIDISFDEWNVWSITKWEAMAKTFTLEDWPVAPRLLEDVYTVADAVVLGGLLISLLRHADRVASASIAQLVNVIGPIMTEPGGEAWRQTTFFPFSVTSRLAHGTSLNVVASGDTVDGGKHGTVPVVDSAATVEDGRAAVFLVNRHQTESTTVTIDLAGLDVDGEVHAEGIWDDDLHAVNDLSNTSRVGLRTNESVRREGDTITIELPPVSWTALSIG